jgi:galactokinase
VLTCAVGQGTAIAFDRKSPRKDAVQLYSLHFEQETSFDVNDLRKDPKAPWADYVKGVMQKLMKTGLHVRAFRGLICGDLPIGTGLSSSAALDVATAETLYRLFGERPGDPMTIARLCRAAENEFVRVPCGLMDPFASLFGQENRLLFLDCRTEQHEACPLGSPPPGIVLAQSGVSHALASGGYARLRASCERAKEECSKQLQRPVTFLIEISPAELERCRGLLEKEDYKRAKHVIEENRRVLEAREALKEGKIERLGELLLASHKSSRDLFGNSCPELDILVEEARKISGFVGGRLTGGGFGGCTVNLVRAEAAASFCNRLQEEYFQRTGKDCRPMVTRAGRGSYIISNTLLISEKPKPIKVDGDIPRNSDVAVPVDVPFVIISRGKVMPRDWLQEAKPEYDVVVIGSGLAGLTAANVLAKCGHRVALLEQHYNLGGMATWFWRKKHIFDISLHGFPYGMIKSCRKYWTREIADSIVQLKRIRFDNPQFSLSTTFDEDDFTRLLETRFRVPPAAIRDFFAAVRKMEFYDDQTMTTRELLERFFPGRKEVMRLLMEPIAYANGSTLEDPAITYGIVFSNFMSKGVFTFQGGTDLLIKKMKSELKRNGVEIFVKADVRKISVERGRATGVVAGEKPIRSRAILSNANLKATIHQLVGDEHFSNDFMNEARAVRLNSSSCQVYMGIRKGEEIPDIGDLFFTSTHPEFDSTALNHLDVTSRTYSVYYPKTRPGYDHYAIISSTNANFEDWANLDRDGYRQAKQRLVDTTLEAIERYIPGVREKIDHVEASTPCTFVHYTRHLNGSTFGTKFEGLKVSRRLPREIEGLFHAGSVGIIMSGWLGAMNYGVIVANDIDKHLRNQGL